MTSLQVDILLVEDNTEDMELTLHALRKENLANNIHVARDGEEALEFLQSNEDSGARPPRLVLLDLKLPKVSGHQVLRAIKSDPRTRSIPVVVLTSSNQDRDLVECYQSGTNSYIQKPVDLQRFQETVRNFGMYWLKVNQPPPSEAFVCTGNGVKQ